MIVAVSPQTEPQPRRWSREEFDRLCALDFFSGKEVELCDGSVHDGAGRRRLWTKEEAYRLAGLGYFQGQRAEYIAGELMVARPQSAPHYYALDRAAELLESLWPPPVWVRRQGPLDLGQTIEPEPDVSVVSGSRESYTGHPTSALLVMEVSTTTLAYDRGNKASLYAAGGVADYWVVDLVHHTVEVRRRPVADTTAAFGFSYADVAVLVPGDIVVPLAAPAVTLAVADLLP